MSTDRLDDPRAFKGFLDEKLSQGGVETLDQAPGLWDPRNGDGASTNLAAIS